MLILLLALRSKKDSQRQMADENHTVRITQADIYKKQLEHGEILVKVLQKLDHLDDVPDRIREVELTLARLAWIERVAYSGLTAAVISLIGLIINMAGK
jgi:hypothetical protein